MEWFSKRRKRRIRLRKHLFGTVGRPRRLQLQQLEQRALLSVGGGWSGLESLDMSVESYVDVESLWLDLDISDGTTPGGEPEFILTEVSPQGVQGEVSLPGAWLETVTLSGAPFTRLTIPGNGHSGDVGAPQIPVVRELLAVPNGAQITAEMVGRPMVVSIDALGVDGVLAPAQAPVAKLAGAMEAARLSFDAAAYSQDRSAPYSGIAVVEAGYSAGQRYVLVEIAPIGYHAAKGVLSIYDTLSFRLTFEGGDATDGENTPATKAAPPDSSKDSGTKAGGRLLVITHDDFAGQLDAYVAHKTAKGWIVDVADTTTAGTSNTQIRSYIRSRYDDPGTRPDAVLLVGDTDRIPHFVGQGSETPATDLYYGAMDDGDDWYPEFPVGRFSVASVSELSGLIAKTIAYETSPAPSSTSRAWTSRAGFIAGIDNNDISEGTHDWVIQQYMDPLNYTSQRLYAATHGATTEDVTNALDDGLALGIYSGHGSEYSWSDGPPFSQSNVRGLSNAPKTPIVASFACVTGAYTLEESYAETWLRAGENGAVAVWASSVNSFWDEDDVLEKRLFDAIYAEGNTAFGDATLRAKELLLEYYGVSPDIRRYFEMYNLFGDPTVEVLGLEFGIRSPSDLPTAYLGEPYEYRLSATGGIEPYTWSVTAGALPVGFQFESDTGRFHGAATVQELASFTVEVTDAEGASVSQTFGLTTAQRLRVTEPTELPVGSLGVPYSATLVADGGVAPYAWSLVALGAYTLDAPSSGYLDGGTPMGWQADDSSWTLALPWEFPFYGETHNSVYVSSNGFLDFSSSASNYSNSTPDLLTRKRIAPLWDDLVTSGGDVYVSETDEYVAIRWDALTFEGDRPADFEAVLYRDGQVQFNYGQALSGLTPTIGVSAGDGVNYTMSRHDGAATIPGGTSTLFNYRDVLPEGVTLDETTGQIAGVPQEIGGFEAVFRVQGSGSPPQTATVEFALAIVTLPPLSVALPADVWEGDGLVFGTVSIPVALDEDLLVSVTSGDSSEVTVTPAITIPAGETSVSLNVSVAEDAELDWLQHVSVTASAADYMDGTVLITVHDNETAVLTVRLPQQGTEGDTLQATVEVDLAPSADVIVTIVSGDPSEVVPVAAVTILAGQTSAPFDISLVEDREIDGRQTASVIGRVENWTEGIDSIDVIDGSAYITLSVPTRVWEGQGTVADAATVSIGGTLTQDLEIALGSDDPSELAVAAMVTIPAGSLSAPIDLTVGDDTDYDSTQRVELTASAAGLTGSSATIDVGDDDVHHFEFEPIADPQIASVPLDVVIRAKDIADVTIEVFQGPIDLTAAGDSGNVQIEFAANKGNVTSVAAPIVAQPVKDGSREKTTLGIYHDYPALTSDLNEYATAYPEITRLVSIGQSVQGRELWALKITDNPDSEEDEPEVKYVSTMHGDEPVGTEMSLYFIDELLGGYGVDSRITSLVDETEIWILPLMNPDGREAGIRENADGVDLNRGFPDGANTPIGNLLDGPPMDLTGRADEVAAVMQWSAQQSFALSANFHTGALVVNYPYDNDGLGSVDSPSDDDALLEYISETYAASNGPMWNSPKFFHGITNGAAWYSIDGGMQDWNYRYLGTNEVTIELSDVYWPAESTLPGFWADNRESMLALFEAVHMGARGVVTDALTGLPVPGSVEVVGNSQPVFTDPDLGDYHRMLLPGTYDLRFSAPGYASRTLPDVTVAGGAVTRLDVSLVPLSAGAVFSAGRWAGTVALNTVDTNVTLAAEDGAGHLGASNPFDLIHGPLDHFQVEPVASPQYMTVPFDVAITAADAHGNPVTDFQGPVELSGRVRAGQVEIGTGTLSWEQPLRAYWQDSRTQTIYLAEEIGPASTISALALDVTAAPGQLLENWTIRMQHTPLGEYASPAWIGDGWTTVYQGDELVADTGWVTFTFATPFEFNGTDNLLIDFSYNNSSYTSNGECRYTDIGQARTLFAYSDSEWGDPLDWSGAGAPEPLSSTYLPNLRLTAARGVPMTPAAGGNFVDGSWAGSVAISAAIEEMWIRVDDGNEHLGGSNTFFVAALPTLIVELPDGVTEGDGLIEAMVTIPFVLADDLLVSVTSDDISELTVVTATVTIAAGQTATYIELMAQDDTLLDGTQRAMLVASADGYYEGQSILRLHDNETAELSLSAIAEATEGDGFQPQVGRIVISDIVDEDVVVTLTSDDPSEVSAPREVTIPAGRQSAMFDLMIEDDDQIDGEQTATITAHVENWTDHSATIRVLDNEDYALRLDLPAEVWEGDQTLSGGGRVSISGTLPHDVIVSLFSDDTRELDVPSAVTIPAGETSATFDLAVSDDPNTDGVQVVTVSATADGFQDHAILIDIGDNEVDHYVFEPLQSPQVVAEPIAVSISARDIDGRTILPYDGKVHLSAAGSGGHIDIDPIISGAFADGMWTGDVTLMAIETGAVVWADDGEDHRGSSNPVDIVPGTLDHLQFDPIDSPQYVDVPIDLTLTAVDAHGYTVTDFQGDANLGATLGAGRITIGTGSGDSWTQPIPAYWEDSRTQVIYLAGEIGSSGTIDALALNVADVPGATLDNWTIRMQHTALDSYSGAAAWVGGGWTTVYAADQTITSTGWVEFEFATPFVYNGVGNLMIDFSYNGSDYSNDGECRYTDTGQVRTLYNYNDSNWGDPLNWSGFSSPAPSATTRVPNIQLNVSSETTVTPDGVGPFVDGVWSGQVTLDQTAATAYLSANAGIGDTSSSDPFSIGLDPPPVARFDPIEPNRRVDPVEQIGVHFSEEVVGFDLSDLVLSLDNGANVHTTGAAEEQWAGSNRGRFNVYEASQDATLARIEIYLDIAQSTAIEYAVYRSSTGFDGTYERIFASATAESGPVMSGTGQRFYDSGLIDVSLQSGKHYMIGAAWSGSVTYYRGIVTPSNQPGDVPFATHLGTSRHAQFPSPDQIDEPLVNESAYYLRLTSRQEVPLAPGEQSLVTADDQNWILSGLGNLTSTAGTYTLRLPVAGSGIEDVAGYALTDEARVSWTVAPLAEVKGRHIFYNNSAFDGNDNAADARDDEAIAPDKTALLPGQSASFAHYTNYTRGINGIMIDVARLAGTPTVDDFQFLVGKGGGSDGWSPAPAPVAVVVRPEAGTEESDRITLTWDDDVTGSNTAIKGQWLQVTVLATENTGLAENDVFYFGNAPGEVGDQAGNALVNATDEVLTRMNQRGPFDPAAIDDFYDFNRDWLVDAIDQIAARSSQTSPFSALRWFTPPDEGKRVRTLF